MSSANDTTLTKLEVFINRNLPKVLAQETANTLGDRSKYIGASDISGCLRKAFLTKQQDPKYDISQHIVFQRGHIAEQLVEKMLKGTPYKAQVEVKGKADNGFDIKAHIDFVVDFGKEVVIVEVKTISTDIDEPYDSWVLQTQLQMSLLKASSQSQIRSYIVAINLNSGFYKTFEIDFNGSLSKIALEKANILANALKNNRCPDGEMQLYCSKCPFKSNCETISKGVEEQLPLDIKSLVNKLKSFQSIEKDMKRCKDELKSFLETTNINVAKCDNTTVTLCQNSGSYTIDLTRLKVEEPSIYEKYRVQTKKYSYLRII